VAGGDAVRLIDADALRAALEAWSEVYNSDPREYAIVQGAFDVLDAAPTIEVSRARGDAE
jgi:hypothetical protein